MDSAVLAVTCCVQACCQTELDFVAINDIPDAKTLVHLLQYDSVHGHLKGEFEAENDALIVNDNPYSSLFDPALTKVMDNNFVKVLSWYDEWGFSSRMRDVTLYIGQRL
jgi:glyceraldehyde-3-phosphate dehydrogenase/erythrose-4-phosphate dehydrogenase